MTPDWKSLLDDLEKTIIETKDLKDKSALIVALDRISDEIKSGERIAVDGYEHLTRLLNSFCTLLQSDFWSFRQIVAVLLMYLYREVGPDFAQFLGSDKDGILQLLLQNVTNMKREVRDAMAQSLGALSSVLGNDVFQYVRSFIDDIVANRSQESYQVMEGLMVMVGYVTCKCPDVSLENWAAMCTVLLDNANNTSFDSYSSYVRLQSVRALYRIVKSPPTSEFIQNQADDAQVKETLDRIEKVTYERLGDSDINVRRAASLLQSALVEDRVQCFPNDAQRIVKDMVALLIEQLSSVETWEKRHGLCEAFFQLGNSATLTSQLQADTVESVLQTLKQNIERDETDASAYAANAAAGKALVQLFISLHKSNTVGSDDDLVTMFRNSVQPELLFMLTNGQPSLLDCASASANSLIDQVPQIVRPFLSDILFSLFKNQFHASYPIRSTAGVVFSKAQNLLGFDTKEALVTDLTPGIITTLSSEANHPDYEVRDAIFKAFENLFQVTKAEEDPATLGQIYEMLKKATLDTTGRFPEVPRSAATRALASYVGHLSKNSTVDVSLVDEQIDSVLELVVELMQDDEPSVVKSALSIVQSLIVFWWEKICGRRITIAAPVFVVSKLQDDELKNAAIPLYVALLGDVRRTFETETDSIVKLFSGLNGSFTLSDENDDEQREAVSAVLRDISACDLSRQEMSTEQWENVLSEVAKGLLLEDNRESDAIHANCMLFLRALSRENNSLGSSINESTKIRALLKSIAHLYLHLLGNRSASDFEFSDDIDELGDEDSGDDDCTIDAKQLEELSTLEEEPEFSYQYVGRNRVIVDTIANLIGFFADEDFRKQYMNSVSSVLRAHASVEDVAPYIPSWVRPLTRRSIVRNIEHLLSEDSRLASLRSVANGSSSVDEDAARSLYSTSIEEGPSADSDVYKGLHLRVISRVAPLAKPDELIKDLSQFACVLEEEVDIDDDDHVFSAEDMQYGYRFGATIEESSPYFVANASTTAVIDFVTHGATSEQDLCKLITAAVECIVDDKDDDEEEVRATKLMLLYYALLAAKSRSDCSAAVFSNDDVQDSLTRLVDEDLLHSVATEEQEDDSSSPVCMWAWRVLEAVGQVLSDVKPDTISSWGSKIVSLLEDESWVANLSAVGTVAAFSACGHLMPVPSKSYLQLLSDMVANEDIDEGKHFLPRVLTWLQQRHALQSSGSGPSVPLILPAPRGMSIRGNSTFSAKQ